MLWTIFVILLILWLLGFIGFHVLGAYIHLLLLIALVGVSPRAQTIDDALLVPRRALGTRFVDLVTPRPNDSAASR